MASPMPESVTISMKEYADLLMAKQSADYVYGIVSRTASSDGQLVSAQEFAKNLLDEWTK